jgi:hypothetical protein
MPPRGRNARRASGQSVTELAILLPVLLAIILVGIDAGRLFFGYVNLTNAARIAANYAATNPAADFVSPGSDYEKTVTNETAGINCNPVTISSPTFSPDTNVGSTASVTVTCAFGLVFPLVGPIPLGATAVFPVRSGTILGVPNPPDPPCDPPKIAVISYVGLSVGDARDAWTALGGTFNPANGQSNKLVTGQIPLPNTCVSAGAQMTVVFE